MSKNSTSNSSHIYGTKNQIQVRKKNGSQSSMNQISSTSRITVQQTNLKALPSLPFPDNPSNLPFILKQNYKAFSDSISDLLSGTNSNIPYYNDLSKHLLDSDHLFSIFINYLQKQNTTLIQTCNSFSHLPPNNPLKNSIQELSESLKLIIEVMNIIADNQEGDEIRQLMTQQFEIISENLSIICNSNTNSNKTIITKPKPNSLSKATPNGLLYSTNGGNYSNSNSSLSSVHNPIIKRLKLIEKQANSIRNLILEQKDSLNHHEILNNLRLFSREINNSFTNEFNNTSLSITNKEKIRYSTITACNDIIQGVKNMISKDTLISKIFDKYEILQNNLNQMLETFGIHPLSFGRLIKPEINETSSYTNISSPQITPSMTLKSIIEASKPYITYNINNLLNIENNSNPNPNNDTFTQFIDTFFTVISIKADDLVQNDFNLSSQIGDFQLKNAQMVSKSRQMEATISELQERLASQTPTTIDDEGVTNVEYMKCLKHVVRKLRLYLNDKNTDYLTYNMPQMMLCVEKLSEELINRTCPTCIEYENAEMKVKEILRPILNSISISEVYEIKSSELANAYLPGCNGELLPMILRTQACFDQLQNENKNLQENVELLTNENLIYKSSIRRIAKEFNDIVITPTTELVSPPTTSTPQPKTSKTNNVSSTTIINIKVKSPNKNINNEESDTQTTDKSTVVDSIISHIQKLKLQIQNTNKPQQTNNQDETTKSEIEKAISTRFSSLFGLDSNQTLQHQFECVKGQLDSQKTLLEESQQTLREVEIALANKFDHDDSHHLDQGTTVYESTKYLVKKIELYESRYEHLANTYAKHEQTLLTNLLSVESTLSGVLKRDPPANLDESQIDQIMSSVIQLSEDVSGWSEKIVREERKKKPGMIKARATIEHMYFKLKKYFAETEKPSNSITEVETSTLIAFISECIDQLLIEANSHERGRNSNLNNSAVVNEGVIESDSIFSIFSGVLKYVSESSRKDPLKFLPEISFKFSILQESVDSLKPFADVLNETFNSFDCKLKSFSPGSESFAFIRNQVFRLQTLLNAVGPSSVNSLVFLVLSKFVSLISSFLSAVSAISYEEEESNKKKAKNEINNGSDFETESISSEIKNNEV